MAARKQKPAPARVAAVETASEQPDIRYLANPITVAHQTPRTREEIALRDAVRKALSDVETLVMDFVDEKLREWFAAAEIDQLYAIELPILVGYRNDNGRIRVAYDAQIVERAA